VKPGVVLDAEEGPIHIDPDATIQPNAVLEGPCYIGPKSIIRPGAVIRAGTTIGPVCKIGGEIDASIIHGYTNKQHDGFLGHSYVAEWINLGADTVNSDLKNTYGTVRVHLNGVGVETGQQFVGSIIGDHAKTGIGTVLPTGCVVGVAANIFTHRSVPKFVPSFAWLTDDGLAAYRVEKAVSLAATVMARRDQWLSDADRRLLEAVAVQAREIEAPGWA
jgi:UDP-N-acetylglucosamine diphosphorylase/glucosamine-1-phosphate N-acetyltransferase